MSDQSAQTPESQQVNVDPQYLIQTLQRKVNTLTNEVSMLEAYIAQEGAVKQELASQLQQAQQQIAVLTAPRDQDKPAPQHKGRVTLVPPIDVKSEEVSEEPVKPKAPTKKRAKRG